MNMQILKIRDSHGHDGTQAIHNVNAVGVGSSYNPLLPQSDTQRLEELVAGQNETMLQIKDVLVDMKSALVSMEAKMAQKDATLQ